jgi:hypothetical protein
MAFRPALHAIEVALHYREHGQELVNTIGFYASNSSPTHAQVVAANALVTGTFLTELLLLMSADVEFYKSVSTALDTAQGEQFILEASAPGAITASEPAPLSVCALVAAKSTHRGKGLTAHSYIGGLVEGEIDGDNITTSLQDELTTVFGLLPLTPNSDGIQWGLISRRNIQAFPIVSYAVRLQQGIQKLRTPGRRRRRAVTP